MYLNNGKLRIFCTNFKNFVKKCILGLFLHFYSTLPPSWKVSPPAGKKSESPPPAGTFSTPPVAYHRA